MAIAEVASDQMEIIAFWANGAKVSKRKHGIAENSTGLPRDLIPDAIFYSRSSDKIFQN